jgi:stress response protein SCP2
MHAVTRQYVDAIAQGMDFKESVRAATTANITLSNEQTIDGVSVVDGDRVLVKNQSTGSQNGIYIVTDGGAWTRSSDADSDIEVDSGLFVFVEEGTANADTGWVLSTNDPITLGSTSLTFTQFSGAGTYTNGNGLTLVGSVFAVDFTTTATDIKDLGVQALGSSNQLARADHVHAHGNLLGGTLHADAVASVSAGFMSGTDKAKLDGIATGAEVNQYAFSNIDVDAATAVLAAEAKTDTLYVTGGTQITLTGTVATDTLNIAVSNGTAENQILLTGATPFAPVYTGHTFLKMTDTPSSYTGDGFLMVNAAGTAVEERFAAPTQGDLLYYNGSIWTTLGISETADYVLTSNGTGANPSWKTIPSGVTTFVALSDVDEADYTGHGGWLVRVNSTPNGLEFAQLTGVPMSATTNQTLYWNGTAWTATSVIFNDVANLEVGINTASPTATLHVAGSFAGKVHTVTAATYDMTTGTNEDIHTLLVNNTAAITTVTLPAVATSADRVYHIKKISGPTYKVTIDANASETIDGAATFDLDIQYESVTLVCDGSSWYIV